MRWCAKMRMRPQDGLAATYLVNESASGATLSIARERMDISKVRIFVIWAGQAINASPTRLRANMPFFGRNTAWRHCAISANYVGFGRLGPFSVAGRPLHL